MCLSFCVQRCFFFLPGHISDASPFCLSYFHVFLPHTVYLTMDCTILPSLIFPSLILTGFCFPSFSFQFTYFSINSSFCIYATFSPPPPHTHTFWIVSSAAVAATPLPVTPPSPLPRT